MQTILIAVDRKTGKDIILAGREVPFPKQREMYREFNEPTHEEYSRVELSYVTPCKKPVKLITKDEQKEREKAHKKLVAAAEAQAKAEAKKKTAKAGKKGEAPAPETGAETTETQIETK